MWTPITTALITRPKWNQPPFGSRGKWASRPRLSGTSICSLNGLQRGAIYYDMQEINGDLLDEAFPNDPDGQLLKGNFWFESDHVDTVGSSYDNSFATMAEFLTTGGVKKTARYRWNFPVQAGGASLQRLHQLVRPD